MDAALSVILPPFGFLCKEAVALADRRVVTHGRDPFAARQFQNQRLIQRRLGGEVERIEALGLWEARQPNAALEVAALAIDALQFAQLLALRHKPGLQGL